jgi:hypothetical protein
VEAIDVLLRKSFLRWNYRRFPTFLIQKTTQITIASSSQQNLSLEIMDESLFLLALWERQHFPNGRDNLTGFVSSLLPPLTM